MKHTLTLVTSLLLAPLAALHAAEKTKPNIVIILADDPFWTAPPGEWTQKRIWSGKDIEHDNALGD